MMVCFAQVKEIDFRPTRPKPQMLFAYVVMQKMHKINTGSKCTFRALWGLPNGVII